MSVNRYTPHLLVIAEDDADQQIIQGFISHFHVNYRSVSVETIAGGWQKVVPQFQRDLLPTMRANPNRHVLLFFDCDANIDRINVERQKIDVDLRDRVFGMGLFDEPESLTPGLGISESDFGHALADECVNETQELWDHAHVRHNLAEAQRLRQKCPFLFRRGLSQVSIWR